MLQNVVSKVAAAVRSNKGISALEYGILAAVIVGAIATAAATLGTDLSNAFNLVGSKITSSAPTK
jgi:pilus assembly protein Flp/PilA